MERSREPLPPVTRHGEEEVVQVRVATGEPLPVLFWQDQRAVYVMPSASASSWLAEVVRSGGCSLAWPPDPPIPCSAELVADPDEAARVRGRFREKYGETRYARYFGPRSKVVRIVPGAPAIPRGPGEVLEQEFNAVAAGYSDAVASNAIEQYLKQTSRDRLLAAFRSNGALLEIGAGTGFETVPLLAAGHEITVVDLSPRMLAELTERARVAGVVGRLTCRAGRLSRLAEALVDLGPGTFEGAYSTFGAFNLEEDLGSAPETLARVLRPGSRLIFTTLNRPGALPLGWEIAAGNGRNALRRAHPALPAGSIRYPLTVYPRNPRFWDRALGRRFRRVGTLPVSVTAPPFESPRLVRWLGPVGGARARRWDERLSRHPMLAPVGEWTFLTYERLP